MLPLGSGKMSLVGAAGWSHVHLGDIDVNGTTINNSDSNGGNITARFGLSIGLH